MSSTDDDRRGPRRYGPNADRTPNPAARAWSELEAENPPTAILPAAELPGAARPGAYPAPGPVGPGAYRAPGQPGQVLPPQTYQPARRMPAVLPPAARRSSGWLVTGRVLTALVSLTVFAVVAAYWGFAASTTAAVADSKGVAAAGDKGVVFRDGLNLLLVGSDSRTDADGNALTADQLAAVGTTLDGGGVNTDTIMVLHIPPGGGRATAVSIPRDTYISTAVAASVQGPDGSGGQSPYKPNKINSYYGAAKFYAEQALGKQGQADSPARQRASNEAGRTMLIKIVQAFTGVKIDHYAEVNLIGFYTLSNAIGGVPVCLNAAVDDSFSGAKFAAGPQTVQGSAAMAFVRQRHGLPGGDLDRVRRQQAFLAGATSKMLSGGVLTNPAKLSALASAADKALTLDSGFDLLSFAQQMSGLSGGNVTFTTIPTHGATQNAGMDALATDPTEIHNFFAALSGAARGSAAASGSSAASARGTAAATTAVPTTTAVNRAGITVDVRDATRGHAAGTPVRTRLVTAGFAGGENTDYPGTTRSTTTIQYRAGEADAARAVQSALGGVGTLAQSDAVTSRHVTVIVGADLAASGLRLRSGAFAAAGPTGSSTGTATGSKAGSSLTAAAVGCVN